MPNAAAISVDNPDAAPGSMREAILGDTIIWLLSISTQLEVDGHAS